MTLFEAPDPIEVPKNWGRLQKRRYLAGLHPANGHEFADNGQTCGSCAHLLDYAKYKKCALNDNTHGPATDIRVGWPACAIWKAP